MDAAYIYLAVDTESPAAHTYACDPSSVTGQINLDFDAMGRLLGIEVVGARAKLPVAVLEQAELIGERPVPVTQP